MNNNALIATALNSHVRIYIINSKEIVEKARQYHDLWPTSCAALGRSLSVTALMAMMQKNKDDVVTTTINGGGSIGTILCVGQANGQVRGFCGDTEINLKYNDTNKLAVGLCVGTDGYLKVTKNIHLKQPYTSEVKLQTGEIGDDYAYYFSISEQRPTIVSVGVLVDKDYSTKSAGAMIIELLPNHSEEDIQYLENLKLESISTVLLDTNIEDYVKSLFVDLTILDKRFIEYKCLCSKEKFMSNLLVLPKKDLLELSKDNEIEIKCEFCNTNYVINKEEINTLLQYVEN